MLTIIKHEKHTGIWTWEELETKVLKGDLKANDQISLEFDGKPALHDVIGIDVDEPYGDRSGKYVTVTIQMHDLLLEEMPFDTKGKWGSNVWETSEIRTYLNSDEFKSRYTDLADHLTTVRKENNSGDDTEDLFFLLSVDELDPKETPYPFYRNKRNLVKFGQDDETDWYWTRSANRSSSHYVWNVYTTGYVTYPSASNGFRSAPACVLIFPIE